jgi:hypothetical protein
MLHRRYVDVELGEAAVRRLGRIDRPGSPDGQ